jgi:hypothetical protein
MAMLDTMAEGRLIVGMLRGTLGEQNRVALRHELAKASLQKRSKSVIFRHAEPFRGVI